MSAAPDVLTHEARTAFVFRWAHEAFELLCDLEQVTAACADGQRYQRLLSLLREHAGEITGRQYVVCKAADAGRATLLVAPRRSHVLRSMPSRDDPYPVEAPLMGLEEALAAELLVSKPVIREQLGAARPTIDEMVRPIQRHLVS